MERTLSQFVPAEEVQKLGSLRGTRNHWLPLPLVFWSFLQMVMDPNSSTREAQRSIQAWWRQRGRSWSEPSSRAFREARIRLPLEWLVRVWWKLADRLSAQSPRAWRGVLAAAGRAKAVDAFIDRLIICALDELPHRPERREPRAFKRRPKPYSLLTAHRSRFTVAASRRNKGQPKRKSVPVPPILCA
ncbi:MAG: hypothetical protein ACKV19_08755 [Verrucomicrobiales bacterium]